MARNKYYYYDKEACAFVEVKRSRSRLVGRFSAFVVVALALAGVMAWDIDQMVQTPQEVALLTENQALQEQLATLGQRMESARSTLELLAETDKNLYRTLLQAEPISDDVRMVGIGGSNSYEDFDRYSSSTSNLLRETAERMDELERQLSLQSSSFRDLGYVAETQQVQLSEMPAIIPAEGPVVSGFGMRRHPILKIRRPHNGIDILVPTGSPIVAPGEGIVKEAGRGGGLGKYVRISHPSLGYTTTFAHLSHIPDHIVVGKRVNRGEVIGMSGNTGLSAAPHLHYEVRAEDGRALNPIYFFSPSMTPQQYKKLLADSEQGVISLD